MSSNTIVQNIKKYVSGSHRFINVGTGSTSVPTDTLVTLAKSTIMTIENGNVGIGTTVPLYALDARGDINFTGILRQGGMPYVSSQWTSNNATNSLYYNGSVGIGTTYPIYNLHNANTTYLQGGSKIVVQNTQDGGNALRGIFYWSSTDTNWVGYMAQSGASRSIIAGTATAGAGFTSYAIRTRANANSTQGFIWENSSEQLLASIRGSDGLSYFAGNVGIGSTIPLQKLHVEGTSYLNGTVTTNNNNINAGTGTITASGLAGGTITDSTSTTSSTIAASATAVKSAYDLANAALPKTGGTVTGNVTILANLTASNLTVIGDTTILNTISSNTEQMVITNAGTGPALKVTQSGVNSVAEFYDNESGLAMTIANNGLVGIGTTNPLSKLHVYGYPILGGTSTDTGSTRFLSILDSAITNGSSKYITFGKANSTNNQAEFSYTHQGDGSATNFIGMGLYGSLAMSINGDGNVGIGTYAPNNKLHLNGNAYLNGTITTNNNNINAGTGTVTASTFSGTATKVSNDLVVGTYLTGTNYNGAGTTTWAVDATSANTASKVVARDASGNFSAGTITASLTGTATRVGQDLVRGIYLTGTNYNGSGTTTWAVDATTTATASKVVARDASAYLFASGVGIGTATARQLLDVQGGGAIISGNVGIGTTNPLIPLHVVGTNSNTIRLQPLAGASGNVSTIQMWGTFGNYPADTQPRYSARITSGFKDSSTGIWGSEYLAFGVGNNGAANDTPIDPLEKVRITCAGNVGIGTTNPLSKLHIYKYPVLVGDSTDIDPNRFISALDSSIANGTSKYITLGKSASLNNQAELSYFHSSDGSANNFATIGLYGGNTLYVTGAGRVGIGKTNPAYKLEVAGDINYTGTLYQNGIAFSGGGGSSQWTTVNTNDIYFNAGNVGIGTNSPLSKLQVKGYPILGGTSTDTDNGRFLSILDSTIANNTAKYICIGKTNSGNNQAEFSYYHVSDGSSANYAGVGLYGGSYLHVTGSGNVGIGTTVPNDILSINVAGANTTGGISFIKEAANFGLKYGAAIRYNVGEDRLIIGSITNYNLIEAITINRSSSYVGIGTTNPLQKLHVEGASYLNGTVTTNNNNINAGTGTVTASTFSGTATRVSQEHVPGTYLTGTNYNGVSLVTWAVDATSANTASKVVVRDASGNFSAGTITASLTGTATKVGQDLIIGTYLTGTNYNGAGTTTWAVDADTAATANKVVARDTFGNIYAANVGIGTGTARYKLDIVGDSLTSGKTYIGTTTRYITLSSGHIQLYNTNNASGIINTIWNSTGARDALTILPSGNTYAKTTAIQSIFEVTNTNNTSSLYVDINGNIGIGTTTPTHKLHIYSASRTDNDYESTGILLDNATQGEAAIAFRNSNIGVVGNVWVMGLNSNSTRFDIGYGDQTSQMADSSAYLSITSNGSVGIGTTIPLFKLHTNGGIYTTKLQVNQNYFTNFDINLPTDGSIGSTGTDRGNIKFPSTGLDTNISGQNVRILTDSSGAISSTRFIVNNIGNVGIGTTAPSHKLHIYSASRTDNDYESTGILLDNATQGEAAIALRNSNVSVAGNVWVMGLNSNSTRFDIGYGQQTNQLADADVELSINTNGNVGIGTTNPIYRLVVGDNTTKDEIVQIQSKGYAGLMLNGDTANTAGEPGGAYVNLTMDGGTTSGALAFTQSGGGDGMGGTFTGARGNALLLYTSTNSALQFGTFGTAVMTLDQIGNVGIGTTNPIYPLHVNGSVYATSYQNIQSTDISNSLGYTPINQIIRFVSNFTNASLSVGNVTSFTMTTNMTCHFVFDFTWSMSTANVPQIVVAATTGTFSLDKGRFITYESDTLVMERALTLGTNLNMVTTGATGTFLSRVIGWVTNSSGASATCTIRAKSNLTTTTLTIGSGTLTVSLDNGQTSF